jgi:tRNA-dihydrouridine synthase
MQSGADAVMIGRAAQGRPWLPGQVARYLSTGQRDLAPSIERQLAWALRVHDDSLLHYGVRTGSKQVRKHLGWALDVAAAGAGAPDLSKGFRRQVLTADSPAETEKRLRDAFAALTWRMAA